jgi:hypothetical protein
LASGLPKGSEKRRAILGTLRRAGRDKQVTVTFSIPPELFDVENNVEGALKESVEDWMGSMRMKHRDIPEVATVMDDAQRTIHVTVR